MKLSTDKMSYFIDKQLHGTRLDVGVGGAIRNLPSISQRVDLIYNLRTGTNFFILNKFFI